MVVVVFIVVYGEAGPGDSKLFSSDTERLYTLNSQKKLKEFADHERLMTLDRGGSILTQRQKRAVEDFLGISGNAKRKVDIVKSMVC